MAYRLPRLLNKYLEFSGVNGFVSTIFKKTIISVKNPLDRHLNNFLNQARAGLRAWFLKVEPVRIVSMCVCVFACVSAPEAINN